MNGHAAEKTRYARLPAWACRILLIVIACLVILPAIPHAPLYIPGERHWGEKKQEISDTKLYKAIVNDIEKGGNYYEAAAAEHRAGHYPTFPPQVFREPALAWLLALLHFHILQLVALLGLYGFLIVSFYRELLIAGKSF